MRIPDAKLAEPRQLRAFRGEADTVIAFDEEDAMAIIEENYGSGEEWREQLAAGEWEWTRLDPAMKLKFAEWSDERANEEHTIAEWIELEGRGILCSTEH